MIAMLAPVPAVILADALELRNSSDVVAFGTGDPSSNDGGRWSFEFFSKDEFANGKGTLKVLIYGSSTDLMPPHPLHRPGHVTAIAVYQGITPAKAGKHPDDSLRPKYALGTDGRWTMFWEVSQLKALSKEQQIPLKALLLPSTGKLRKYAGIPRGPMLVVVPEPFAAALQ
jgi:hypothetical protein